MPGIEELEKKSRAYMPFTALNLILRLLRASDGPILDVGCGKGEPMEFINRNKRFLSVGIDVFKPYLDHCKSLNIHDTYVLCDARKLPFQRKSFDTILCIEVLEHLEKEEGYNLLYIIEELARKQIVLSSPMGVYVQEPYDKNPYQEHRSSWSPYEFKRLGYRVKGIGLRGVADERGIASLFPRYVRNLIIGILWVLGGIVSRFIPILAGHIMCTKKL